MAEDPYWDDEVAKGRYSLPLPIEEREASERQEESLLTLSLPPGELYVIPPFNCAKSPQSHKGPYRWAIDFLVNDGTPVIAARDGVVIESVDEFTKWGDDPELAKQMNLVTIRHEGKDGPEFSQYCHLARGSVKVNVGDQVRRGQRIALVGKVGWTDRDHLHFIVFRNDARGPGSHGFKSLRVKFV
jgi:murein DD-endopeptidase MepM/ murein hydrolase activator NlpD